MSVHLQSRDLPDDLPQELRQRAAARGVSLRQYALDVLMDHCCRPTLEEWLDGLSRLPQVAASIPAAEAVRQAREEDDAALVEALRRP